jgi:hypothetical protein
VEGRLSQPAIQHLGCIWVQNIVVQGAGHNFLHACTLKTLEDSQVMCKGVLPVGAQHSGVSVTESGDLVLGDIGGVVRV